MYIKKMKSLSLVLLLAALSCVLCYEEVKILHPDSLKGSLYERPALFGVPAYEESVVGYVVLADPIQACTALEQITPPESGLQPIVMIDRGGTNCHFVKKVRNAQNVGAKAVIIANNIDTHWLPYMADDGTGHDLTTPSVIIRKSDADTIKAAINGSNVIISMTWSIPHPDGIVEWSFWTKPWDYESYELKKVFKTAQSHLLDKAVFTPHQYIVTGLDDAHCTNHGRYCATVDNNAPAGVTGKEIIKETLRQLCVWKHVNHTNQELLWWDYTWAHDMHCGVDKPVGDECSNDLLDQIGIDHTEIDTCMTDSGSLEADAENTLLQEELVARATNGIFVSYQVVINNVKYFGSLTCPDLTGDVDITQCGVLEAICAGYAEDSKPSVCSTATGCPLGVEYKDSCGVCGGVGPDACGVCYWNGQANSNFKTNSDDCNGDSPNGNEIVYVIIIAVVVALVIALAVYLHMRRQQSAMRDDIDNLLQRYLPLDEANSLAHPSRQAGAAGGAGGHTLLSVNDAPSDL